MNLPQGCIDTNQTCPIADSCLRRYSGQVAPTGVTLLVTPYNFTKNLCEYYIKKGEENESNSQ